MQGWNDSPLAWRASANPRLEHLPFLTSADKCQANAPSALSWRCCPFLWLLSEVAFNEDFKWFLQAGAGQASPPGPKSTLEALLMNPAGRRKEHRRAILCVCREGSKRSAPAAAAAPEQRESRTGHDEYFMVQRQGFASAAEWRAQHS